MAPKIGYKPCFFSASGEGLNIKVKQHKLLYKYSHLLCIRTPVTLILHEMQTVLIENLNENIFINS
jgi:hypothetical protein